jgi:GNAT superfamily N-acetyltransferase
MLISYRLHGSLPTEAVVDLYRDSGLNRPIDDHQRIAAMYANSNVVVSAWDEELLVGVARSLSDLVYCCYLSDLAVLKAYQGRGIGRELVARTKAYVGDGCMILLLSAAGAMSYYPLIGMEEVRNGFQFQRSR